MQIVLKISCFILVSILVSCGHQGTGKCTETNISTKTRASHNGGRDCARCHQQGNDGRGCFTVCGTVFKSDLSTPMSDAVMVLFSRDVNDWTKITGVSKPIPVDKTGNFYTTESIDFVGKYPAIIKNGDTIAMSSPLDATASCNSCHSSGKESQLSSQGVIYDNIIK